MPAGREKAIFLGVLEFDAAAEREAYLAEACADDASLRQAVDALLVAHGRATNVLDSPPEPCNRLVRQLGAAVDRTLDLDRGRLAAPAVSAPPADRSGEWIGRYRLMELIGEGGFGLVYVAQQQQPVRRRVALKLLKPEMASREVIARFEAERQALAMMDHPNIARVFDAGATAAGQPYFVMELVHGAPVTEFCERQRLSTGQRLELFFDVCQAVQHAHHKGVIHRDLKPSNVMVTLHDATPVVKVIDFGVAKAVGDPLTDKTVYTRFAQMIGTPMYMSPEQAEMSGLDVDTRSDIYSLGVLLYELLTGTTPFDERRLRTASFDELRRIIREEEPPRPSDRLSTLSPKVTTPAAGRQLGPRWSATALRGELDWIVMKALEKDRRRRYETAADLARDVRRYLEQQPVIARPPSAWYRIQKFAQRNRVTFVAAALVLLALVTGTSVSVWQAVRATRAYAEAESLRQDAVAFASRLKEANVLLDSARANANEQRWTLAWSQYTKATQLQPDHYLTWAGRGSLYVRLGAWRAAAADYAKALELDAPANNPGWWGVPQLCAYAGEENAYRLACATLREQLDQSEDPAFVSLVIRSLAVRPLPRDEARTLAERVEQLLERRQPGEKNQAPSPGPPPAFSFASHDRPPPGGPPEGGRDFGPPGRFPPELLWYAAGLAHYRAGEIERALERLKQVVESEFRFPPTRIVLPVLAMARHASGQMAEAERTLAEAGQALDEWTSALREDAPVQLSIPWFDFIECWLLYREAYERIRGTPLAASERLAEFERRALAALRK
ncbi:MAG TPA: serine/threonine-protein kinase [Pirellulales bacterium]|nr:serine/threonine-protein kinase [Pirellulales bacterium]